MMDSTKLSPLRVGPDADAAASPKTPRPGKKQQSCGRRWCDVVSVLLIVLLTMALVAWFALPADAGLYSRFEFLPDHVSPPTWIASQSFVRTFLSDTGDAVDEADDEDATGDFAFASSFSPAPEGENEANSSTTGTIISGADEKQKDEDTSFTPPSLSAATSPPTLLTRSEVFAARRKKLRDRRASRREQAGRKGRRRTTSRRKPGTLTPATSPEDETDGTNEVSTTGEVANAAVPTATAKHKHQAENQMQNTKTSLVPAKVKRNLRGLASGATTPPSAIPTENAFSAVDMAPNGKLLETEPSSFLDLEPEPKAKAAGNAAQQAVPAGGGQEQDPSERWKPLMTKKGTYRLTEQALDHAQFHGVEGDVTTISVTAEANVDRTELKPGGDLFHILCKKQIGGKWTPQNYNLQEYKGERAALFEQWQRENKYSDVYFCNAQLTWLYVTEDAGGKIQYEFVNANLGRHVLGDKQPGAENLRLVTELPRDIEANIKDYAQGLPKKPEDQLVALVQNYQKETNGETDDGEYAIPQADQVWSFVVPTVTQDKIVFAEDPKRKSIRVETESNASYETVWADNAWIQGEYADACGQLSKLGTLASSPEAGIKAFSPALATVAKVSDHFCKQGGIDGIYINQKTDNPYADGYGTILLEVSGNGKRMLFSYQDTESTEGDEVGLLLFAEQPETKMYSLAMLYNGEPDVDEDEAAHNAHIGVGKLSEMTRKEKINKYSVVFEQVNDAEIDADDEAFSSSSFLELQQTSAGATPSSSTAASSSSSARALAGAAGSAFGSAASKAWENAPDRNQVASGLSTAVSTVSDKAGEVAQFVGAGDAWDKYGGRVMRMLLFGGIGLLVLLSAWLVVVHVLVPILLSPVFILSVLQLVFPPLAPLLEPVKPLLR
ncbi:unnamed protein product [Amoebophrya sp. A120]|nr:unnamed protein product [Amoebophrya sp. A120]|eukprot:GSA120T00002721001.1